MAGIPKPSPCYLDDFEKWKIVDGRQVWRNKEGSRLYTWDSLHGEESILVKKHLDQLAEDSATFKSGSSKIIWWRFAKKLKAPKTLDVQGSATDLLQQIVEEFFPDKAEAKFQVMSINGVIGAANGGYVRDGKKGDLFTILKHRFAHRSELTEIIAHPSFEIFLQKRIEEIASR